MGLRKQGKKAMVWSLVIKFLKRGITFIMSIFLARLLEPSDFGLLAMISVFTAFAEVFYDLGMGQALVQKKTVTETQYSTVFYINIMLGVLVYVIMWFSAPYIASFYDTEILVDIVRVSTLTFIISSFSIVNTVFIRRSLEYSFFVRATLMSSTLSGVVGIGLAYLGYGVWSLVLSGIVYSLVRTIVLWVLTSWKPQVVFDLKSIKDIWKKGLGFLNLGIINNTINRLDNLVIGKIFDAGTLGLFNRAKSLEELPQNTFILPISQPMFPIFSQLQSSFSKIEESFFQLLHLLNFLTILIFGFMYLSAENLVVILYSEKWIESVPYLRILLFLLPLFPFSVLVTSLLKGIGNLRMLTYLTIFDRFAIFFAMGFGIKYGLIEYLYAFVGFKYLSYFVRLIVIQKYVHLSSMVAFISILKLGGIVSVLYVLLSYIELDSIIVEFLLRTGAFVLLFVGSGYLFNIEGFNYAKNEFKTLWKGYFSK